MNTTAPAPPPNRAKTDRDIAAALRVWQVMNSSDPTQTSLYQRQQRLDTIVGRIKKWRMRP